VIARFTQEDVYRGDGLNLYVYVVNNPLLWIDPSGHSKKCSQNNNEDINASDTKADFIVTPNGVAMLTNKDYNLVPSTNEKGDWIQIHNKEPHDNLLPHTHFPEISTGGNGHTRVNRRYKATDAEDIEYADKALRDGSMRERINKRDKGGTIK